jgi:hypothetical protein
VELGKWDKSELSFEMEVGAEIIGGRVGCGSLIVEFLYLEGRFGSES